MKTLVLFTLYVQDRIMAAFCHHMPLKAIKGTNQHLSLPYASSRGSKIAIIVNMLYTMLNSYAWVRIMP